MVGASFPRIYFSFRTRLELTVFQHCESDSSVDHVAIIDADTLFDGRGVEGCRVVCCLGSLYGVHEVGVHGISTC